MKKLMLLGSMRYLLPVIREAHKLGVYVITCDYLPDGIAHKYSDEYVNVSIIDKDAVLEKAQQLQIDGIMSFACDPGVVTAAYVAEKMGLPSVGSYKSVCILQNKAMFRKFLSEHGFNVPFAKGYHNADEALKDVDLFHWPVIVKPTDSAGSKGVTKVDSSADLAESVRHALSFSHCKEFIVEDFILQKGYSSDSDCFSVNGKLKFVSFDSQYFDKNAGNPYTPAAYSWPSSMSEKYQEELKQELQRLIDLLGLGTSVYNVETREDYNGKAYIMEFSPRGGGNRLSECLEYATGVKLVENAVRAALGMEIVGVDKQPYNGCWAEIVLHSEQQGIFKDLWIADSIQDNIVEKDLWVRAGDKVGAFSAANESLGTLVLRFNDNDELKKVLENIGQYVRIELSN